MASRLRLIGSSTGLGCPVNGRSGLRLRVTVDPKDKLQDFLSSCSPARCLTAAMETLRSEQLTARGPQNSTGSACPCGTETGSWDHLILQCNSVCTQRISVRFGVISQILIISVNVELFVIVNVTNHALMHLFFSQSQFQIPVGAYSSIHVNV